MAGMKTLYAMVLAVGLPIGVDAAEVLRYEGSARDADSGALLYRETHFVEMVEGRIDTRLVLYRCPGRDLAFARKAVRYGSVPEQPEFELTDARLGYREGLQRRGNGSVETFVRPDRDSVEQRAGLVDGSGIVADAGFDEFLKRHWDALQRGEEVRLDFLVPARLGAIGFKIRKHRDDRAGDREVSVIRLSLGAWWGFIAPHIDAAYDRQTRQLLRYRGLSNLRDADGRNLNVDIVFPPELRRETTLASVDRARRSRLVDACGA
jgi:hypothetical protein